MCTDTDIARIIAAKILLTKPDDREDLLREIPPARLARVLTILPGVMASYFDQVTAADKNKRLQFEGILRTFLQATRDD